MHQARQSVTTKIPIERKGTKYIVRSSSHINDSVPLLIAVRDILGLAKTAREVKHMIQTKLLKINGRLVEDFKESIKLSIF
jgi:small subunit ribosomal protein S4e